MPGTDEITGSAQCKPMAMKAPGNNSLYYLFTVSADNKLLCHVINSEFNSGFGSIVATNITVIPDAGMQYHNTFALMEDHTAPNRSKLYIRRFNAQSGVQEYVMVTIKNIESSENDLLDADNMFIPATFQLPDMTNNMPYGEMQISPDGRYLYAAHNYGGVVPVYGKIVRFLLDAENNPQFSDYVVSATGANAINEIDLTAGSAFVYYAQTSFAYEPGKTGSPWLYRADAFNNTGTGTSVSVIRGAVRRLADGNLYFKKANNTTLIKISNAETSGWQIDEANFPPLTDNVFRGLHATQPHRKYQSNHYFTRKVGETNYELTDHLGNVRATLTDRKVAAFDSNYDITGFTADITSANDYFSFGWGMPGRSLVTPDGYSYGFQGQEKDDEIKGSGNSLNFTFRQYDARIGRFFAVDPLSSDYPHYSPYMIAGNKMIAWGELEGLEEYFAADGKYIGTVGDDPTIRIIKNNDVLKAIPKMIDDVNSKGKYAHITAHALQAASEAIGPYDVFAHQGIFNHYYSEAGFKLSEHKNSNITIDALISGLGNCGYDNSTGLINVSVNSELGFWPDGSFQNKHDIINFFVHEAGAHGSDWKAKKSYNYESDYRGWEQRAIRLQINHPSWEHTSPHFKEHMFKNYSTLISPQEITKFFNFFGIGRGSDGKIAGPHIHDNKGRTLRKGEF